MTAFARFLLVLLVCPSSALLAQESKPNILWITIDDAGPDFGCYGTRVVETPRIDELAGKGQRFDLCWTAAPVCSPTRSSLLTGCYPQTIGSHHHRSKRDLPEGIVPITEILASAGYAVVRLPFERQKPEAFHAGTAPSEGALATVTGGAKQDFNFSRGSNLFGDWTQRGEGAPFFTLVDFHGPKTGQGTGKAHAWARAAGRGVDPASLELPPYWVDTPDVRRAYARYFEGIALLDAEVGRLLDWLEAEDLMSTTWIVLWGDHGLAMARHKQWCYEGGLRVPLLIAGPGLESGVRTDLVSSIDVAATTLGCAGLQVPDWMEGNNLFSSKHAAREYLFAGRDRCDETEDRVRAVRNSRYALIRNLRPELSWIGRNAYTTKTFPGIRALMDGRDAGTLTPAQAPFAASKKPAWEFYDLDQDPHQLTNLAGDPVHMAAEARLRTQLLGWMQSIDAANPYPEKLDTIVPAAARAAVESAR